MPITILEPVTGQPAGPGFTVHVSTDITAPLPPGAFWQLWLERLEGGNEIIAYGRKTTTDKNVRILIGQQESTWVLFAPEWSDSAQGDTVRLHVALMQDPIVLIEEATTTVVYDTQTAVPFLVQELAQATTTGGFTATDREDLQVVKMAAGFGIGGGWSDALGDLLGAVGRRIFNDVLIVPDRSGEGQLIPPAPGLFGVPFGVQWQLVSKPDGFGIDEGVPDRTEIDFMQLSYMYDSDIGLVPRDSRYVRDLRGRWVWGAEWPDSLDYFIMPGVTVRFWWIVINPSLP